MSHQDLTLAVKFYWKVNS